MYATESVGMLDKALRLIQAAERDLDEEARGIVTLRGNPFGKAWGYRLMETSGSKLGYQQSEEASGISP